MSEASYMAEFNVNRASHVVDTQSAMCSEAAAALVQRALLLLKMVIDLAL